MAKLREAARQGFRDATALDHLDFQPLRAFDPDGFAALRDQWIEHARAMGEGVSEDRREKQER